MIMAVENEFGIAGGNSIGKATVIQNEVAKTMPVIPSKGRGVYLANGGRAYVDAGCQNEYCTPETSNPAELVIHELAGRKLMADAAVRAGQTLLCSNVDPVYETTWGSHENYSSTKPLAGSSAIMPLLVHLATRMPYTGAGGLSLSHSGISVVMSPRAHFLRACLGQQGVDRRTLLFNKQTNHGQLYRNHIICGENLLSHYAGYLKYATTALIVACIDAGLPLSDIRLRQPLLRVINRVNRDLNMQRLYELSDGRLYTVLDVQECLLESVEVHLPQLPTWAPRAVHRWHQVLDHLRGGYEILNTRIDWMLYRHLLSELCSELGVDSGDLLIGGNLRSGRGPVAPRDLKAYANELYLRLHMLNRESLFGQMEAENRLDHHLSDVSAQAVDHAMKHPSAGRAAERAALIQKYWKEEELKMTWASLEDGRDQPSSNPIEYDGSAIKIILAGDSVRRQRQQSIIVEAESCFRRGDYDKALALYNGIPQIEHHEDARHCVETICLSCARSGNKSAALQMLDVHAGLSTEFGHQLYRLFCTVNFGLIPPASVVGTILQKCDSLLGGQNENLEAISYHRFILEQCRAIYLHTIGHSGKAAELCRTLLENPHHHFRTRMSARTRCFLAVALLSEGRAVEASSEIGRALRSQISEGLHGDLATYSYPLIARIQDDDTKAGETLRKAEAIHQKLNNPLGLSRLLYIKARRLGTSEDLGKIEQLRHQCTALKDCRLADRIMTNWEEWIAAPDSTTPSDYWGM